MRKLASVLMLAVVSGLYPSAASTPAPPQLQGPDIPPATAPAATVVAFDGEYFTCTDEVRTHSIDVPSGWNRVILSATIAPDGDPWDRLFGVAIGGVEVLRATTPRTTFTLRKDVTEFSTLLPQGGTAAVSLRLGTYVGAMRGSVSLEFYANEPTSALVASPKAVANGFAWHNLDGSGDAEQTTVAFPATAPSSATVDLTLSGHGVEEFWYQSGVKPRQFRILVDGVEVAFAESLPYTYALLGFGNANANNACSGPGTALDGDLLHPVMWWTAQQAADAAGIHTGTGEIPPFRAIIEPANLPLLAGARTVRVEQVGGLSTWVTSLSFLLQP